MRGWASTVTSWELVRSYYSAYYAAGGTTTPPAASSYYGDSTMPYKDSLGMTGNCSYAVASPPCPSRLTNTCSSSSSSTHPSSASR